MLARRTRNYPFQFDRPVFVRIPFKSSGRVLEKGSEFKWKERGVDERKVLILYRQGYLHHNSERETEIKVGDGLEAMNMDELHALVNEINEKVKKKTKNEAEFLKKKCKMSRILDKQRGLIRSWRYLYGQYEVD